MLVNDIDVLADKLEDIMVSMCRTLHLETPGLYLLAHDPLSVFGDRQNLRGVYYKDDKVIEVYCAVYKGGGRYRERDEKEIIGTLLHELAHHLQRTIDRKIGWRTAKHGLLFHVCLGLVKFVYLIKEVKRAWRGLTNYAIQ